MILSCFQVLLNSKLSGIKEFKIKVGMSSARHSPGIQETFLGLVNYLGGILSRENGQESRNFKFLLLLNTNVPKIPEGP